MTLLIRGIPEGGLDIKRCHLPGVKIRVICPECEAIVINDEDFDGDQFNYPVMNKPVEHPLWCDKCNHKWTETVTLEVRLVKS